MHFQGIAYRAHNPQWAWAPLSGEGAKKHGGRFNRPGRAALYAALKPLTAIREVSQLGRPLQPLTLCAYRVDSRPVFDSRDQAAMDRAGVEFADLHCPTWRAEMLDGGVPRSQALAARLEDQGFVGLVTNSFAPTAGPEDYNLVLWTWNAGPESRVEVVDDEHRLPRDQSSWSQ